MEGNGRVSSVLLLLILEGALSTPFLSWDGLQVWPVLFRVMRSKELQRFRGRYTILLILELFFLSNVIFHLGVPKYFASGKD